MTVVFRPYEMRSNEPFFLMYGFSHEWGNYKLEDWQIEAMRNNGARRAGFQAGVDLARGIRNGTRPVPLWLSLEGEEISTNPVGGRALAE